MICDFCSAPNPAHEIPVRSFKIDPDFGSAGNFMACDACKQFIDADDHDGLFAYSMSVQAKKYPQLLVNGELHPVAKSEVRKMQDLFWANRIR